MAFWHRKKRPAAGAEPDLTRLPRHIGIIMDGNGRWAKKRGLPRTAGHAAGAETFRTIAYRCRDLGIPYLTVYAFSTENWKRPVEEVSAIMDLLRKYLLEALEKMEKDGFRIRFFGDLEALPPELRTLCLETEETGAAVAGARYQINVCLNYGGRDEILRAARAWAAMAGRSFVTPDDIQALIHPVLAHRLLLTNEARLSGVTADGVLDQIAAQLPVPPAAGDEFHGA